MNSPCSLCLRGEFFLQFTNRGDTEDTEKWHDNLFVVIENGLVTIASVITADWYQENI